MRRRRESSGVGRVYSGRSWWQEGEFMRVQNRVSLVGEEGGGMAGKTSFRGGGGQGFGLRGGDGGEGMEREEGEGKGCS